jgi:hypothetical protein
MDLVTGAVITKAVQAITDAVTDTAPASEQNGEDSFEGVLKSILNPDSANQINEEELFAALLEKRIGELKGQDAAAKFHEALQAGIDEFNESSGYVCPEAGSNAALANLVESEVLTEDESKELYDECFAAAQLDDNPDLLYDSRGGENDPTIAIMDMDAALVKARAYFDGAADTTESPAAETDQTDAALSSASLIKPEGTSIDGEGEGLLFDPLGDGSGKLEILLPAQADAVLLKDLNGKLIAEGTAAAETDDQDERKRFQFDEAGEAYPRKLVVEVQLKDGTKEQYLIPDPSKLYD